MIDTITKNLNISSKSIKNLYLYGSRVYGTNDSMSDYDFIIICDDVDGKIDGLTSPDEKYNATLYSVEKFQEEIDNHEISILECLFLPEAKIFKKEIDFTFELELNKLRSSISTKSSNSWVKCKKKLIVDDDYNPLIAKKSLFHVFRILHFGIQIAKNGKIIDYTEANGYWNDIKKLEPNWDLIKSMYQKDKNRIETEFKKLAPKI